MADKKYTTLRELREQQRDEDLQRERVRDEYVRAKEAEHRAQIAADPGVQALKARATARAEERAALAIAQKQAVLAHAKAEVDAAVQAARGVWVQTNGDDADFDEKATRQRIAQARVASAATDPMLYRPRL